MGEVNNTNNTHVPDKLYSFVLQVRHLLYELLSIEDDNAIVSTEAIDDVAVENGEAVIAIQIKSSQSKNNPISNRAVDFWKTMYNWMQYCEDNTLDINNTEFKLVVNALKEKNFGTISEKFNKASEKCEILIAIEEAKQELFGSEKNIGNIYRKYIEYFFDDKKLDLAIKIISKFSIVVFNNDYDISLKEKFRNRVLCDEYYEELYEYMQGWIQEHINEQLKYGKPAFIKYSDFRAELEKQLKMYRHSKVLEAISVENTRERCKDELKKRDNYIKQLEEINVNYDDKISAINAFLRQSIDKTEWAKRGLFTNKSLCEYEKGLLKNWDLVNKMKKIEQPHLGKEEFGRLVYYKCIGLETELQGNKLPIHFTEGYYNNLANEIKIRLASRF